jgi:hypothetical protein
MRRNRKPTHTAAQIGLPTDILKNGRVADRDLFDADTNGDVVVQNAVFDRRCNAQDHDGDELHGDPAEFVWPLLAESTPSALHLGLCP